jgi:hypothetical protein
MKLSNRLTYANVASTLALVIAVGGGGAAVAAVAKNSVGSPQLKAGAVQTSDLGNNAVVSAKVKDGSLTGGDINESTLGKVPSAATADSATTATTATTADNVLRATIRSDGTVVADQSSAGVTTQPTGDGTGTYAVLFDRSVRDCTPVVNVTDPGVGYPSVAGSGGTTGLFIDDKGVYVVMWNAAGTLTNLAFSMVVVC